MQRSAVSMAGDAPWLSTGWVGHQTSGVNNLRYYKRPPRTRPIVSATRNRLLNCNPVPMTTRESSTKLKEIKDKYRILNLERQRLGTLEHEYVPYVTKVQINKKQADSRTSTATTTVKSKNNHSKQKKITTPSINEAVTNERHRFLINSLNISGDSDPSRLRSQRSSATEPAPQAERMSTQHVNDLIMKLYEQLSTTGTSRRGNTRTRPLATFARPTKGEIALREKGFRPVNPRSRVESQAIGVPKTDPRQSSTPIETDRSTEKTTMRSKDQEKEKNTRLEGVRGRPVSKSAPHRQKCNLEPCLCSDCKKMLKYKCQFDSYKSPSRSHSTDLTELSYGRYTCENDDKRLRLRLNLSDLKRLDEHDVPPAAPPSPTM